VALALSLSKGEAFECRFKLAADGRPLVPVDDSARAADSIWGGDPRRA